MLVKIKQAIGPVRVQLSFVLIFPRKQILFRNLAKPNLNTFPNDIVYLYLSYIEK